MKRVRNLVISRKLWGKAALLNSDGTMCCLGFTCIAYGVQKSYLRPNQDVRRVSGSNAIGFPGDLPKEEKEKLPIWLRQMQWAKNKFTDVGHLSYINDERKDEGIDRSAERKIQRRFLKHNITVKFVP